MSSKAKIKNKDVEITIEFIKNKVSNDLKIINYYLDDIVLNKPKEKEVFQKTLKNYKCSNCKFRMLCNDDSV